MIWTTPTPTPTKRQPVYLPNRPIRPARPSSPAFASLVLFAILAGIVLANVYAWTVSR